MQDFAKAGGQILGIRPSDPRLDGRTSNWPDQLPVQWASSLEKLADEVLRQIPPRLKFDPAPPTGVAHQRRECDDGTYYLIVNSSPKNWTAHLTVAETGGMQWLNPETGEIELCSGSIYLAACSAGVLWVNPRQAVAKVEHSGQVTSKPGLTLELLEARALEPNVLVLDTCALEVRGESFPRQLVYESNRIFWEKNGMETNGWASTVQYRDNLLSANARMSPDSGGIARYPFLIGPGTDLRQIDLCFECPEQWQVRVNGQAVKTGGSAIWLDCHIARVKVGPLLREGENLIELVAQPFDVRQEIDQVYLLGSFAVQPEQPGFVIAPVSRPLALGSWKSHGLPFYDRKVAYRFLRPKGVGRVVLSKADWYGSVLDFTCGQRHIQTYGPSLDVSLTAKDPEEFTLTVTGLPLNLLGPWHKPSLLAKHGWASFWHGGDIPNAPQAGKNYHLLDLGLFSAPRWVDGC